MLDGGGWRGSELRNKFRTQIIIIQSFLYRTAPMRSTTVSPQLQLCKDVDCDDDDGRTDHESLHPFLQRRQRAIRFSEGRMTELGPMCYVYILYQCRQRSAKLSEGVMVVVVFMLIDVREVFCLKLISLNRISRNVSPCTWWRSRIICVFHCKSFHTFVLYTTAFFFCNYTGCSRDQYNKFFAPFSRRR